MKIIVYTRLNDFGIKNNLISKSQFGFVKNKGANDPLANTSNFIYTNLDKNLPTGLVFLYFAKAFNTVNHNILLDKLWRGGIRGILHQLPKNYLQDREQSVKIGNIISER